MCEELNNLAFEIEDLYCRRVEALLWASINALLDNCDCTLSPIELQARVADMLEVALEEIQRQEGLIQELKGKAIDIARSLDCPASASCHSERAMVRP